MPFSLQGSMTTKLLTLTAAHTGDGGLEPAISPALTVLWSPRLGDLLWVLGQQRVAGWPPLRKGV